MTTFGRKLRYLREEKKLTQAELAAAINKKYPETMVTRDLIANWENDRHYPFIPVAIKMCDFFKITLDELFREKISLKSMAKHRELEHEKVPN
jgi:transcriptional regulator with XRE-family HTH domain